jgi:DNA-binding MltR family transcriptional regulator
MQNVSKHVVGSMSIDDYAVIRAEIDAQTDRGAAIIACSLLEEHLNWSIDKCFVELSPKTSKRIFEGPLGSLFNRSYIGYALGLYDRDAREEIIRIGEIRNHFAHKIAPIDFADDAVAETCDKLRYPTLHRDIIGSNASNREKYLHSCWILRALVTNEIRKRNELKSPNHEVLLGVLAEALLGSLPHDRSSERPSKNHLRKKKR